MCFYIGIEDLAANAMIEMLKKEYGEKAVLILSRENTDALFRNYSDFFEEGEQDGKKGIKLKIGKEIDDLIRQFRGYLALDVLLAFMNQRSVQVLGA